MTLFFSGCIFIIFAALHLTSAELPLTVTGGRYYYYGQGNYNWQGAENFCVANGLRLAAFETVEELNIVSHWLLHERGFPNDWQMWISGNNHHGNFKWISTNTPIYYNNWAPGQPDNYFWNEHCMTAWHHTGTLRYNDRHCDANLYFLCEKP